MQVRKIALPIACLLLESCASTNARDAQGRPVYYGECDVTELERITFKLAREKYPDRSVVLRYPFMFIDLGDKLRFFTQYPEGWRGGSPTAEFDKEFCELIRIYETE